MNLVMILDGLDIYNEGLCCYGCQSHALRLMDHIQSSFVRLFDCFCGLSDWTNRYRNDSEEASNLGTKENIPFGQTSTLLNVSAFDKNHSTSLLGIIFAFLVVLYNEEGIN